MPGSDGWRDEGGIRGGLILRFLRTRTCRRQNAKGCKLEPQVVLTRLSLEAYANRCLLPRCAERVPPLADLAAGGRKAPSWQFLTQLNSLTKLDLGQISRFVVRGRIGSGVYPGGLTPLHAAFLASHLNQISSACCSPALWLLGLGIGEKSIPQPARQQISGISAWLLAKTNRCRSSPLFWRW